MSPRTFVLIHGAWHGGWCWRDVAAHLRAGGHQVFAPTLTGLGERVHLARPEVDLELHVADVLGVLDAEELTGVTLVGHSYGGMVTTVTADRAPGRIAALTYLDAHVPRDGESMFSLQPADATERMRAGAIDGWRMPPVPVAFLGLNPDDPATGGWAARRMVPQPIRTWEQAARLSGPGPTVPRRYIHCVAPNMYGVFDRYPARFAGTAAWTVARLEAGHDAMISHPFATAAALLG